MGREEDDDEGEGKGVGDGDLTGRDEVEARSWRATEECWLVKVGIVCCGRERTSAASSVFAASIGGSLEVLMIGLAFLEQTSQDLRRSVMSTPKFVFRLVADKKKVAMNVSSLAGHFNDFPFKCLTRSEREHKSQIHHNLDKFQLSLGPLRIWTAYNIHREPKYTL